MWEPGTPPFRLEHCWKDVLRYPTTPPAECLQNRPTPFGTFETIGSADCLTLDIYTPFIGYDTPSPVVVVIALPTLFGGWPDESHKSKAKVSFDGMCNNLLKKSSDQIKLLRQPLWHGIKASCLSFRVSVWAR